MVSDCLSKDACPEEVVHLFAKAPNTSLDHSPIVQAEVQCELLQRVPRQDGKLGIGFIQENQLEGRHAGLLQIGCGHFVESSSIQHYVADCGWKPAGVDREALRSHFKSTQIDAVLEHKLQAVR